MLDQSYYRKTDEIIQYYGPKPASLIPIMQDIQAEYRYLPGELLTYVASQIGVTEAKAFSVATFMRIFHLSPKGNILSRSATEPPVMCVIHAGKRSPDERTGAQPQETHHRRHDVYRGDGFLSGSVRTCAHAYRER